jgi:mannosyltransferase
LLRRLYRHPHVLRGSGLHVALLCLIVILGSVLRFCGLGRESLWNDELASWLIGNQPTLSGVLDEVAADIHPPGYQILLYYVQQHLGETEFLLRLPSALAGAVAVPLTYLLGRRIYSGREGLISCAMMAVMWAPIYYSQEARAYSLLLLAVLAAAYFWVPLARSLIEGRIPELTTVFGYILCAAAACYLHYFGLLFVALQGAVAALPALRNLRGLALALAIYGAVALTYLPWLPGMLYQLEVSSERGGWIPAPEPAAAPDFARFLFNGSAWLLAVALALFGFLLARSLLSAAKEGRVADLPRSPGLLLALWLSGPFVIAYAASVLFSPILTERNLIISLPAACLLLARSVTRLPGGAMGQSAAALGLAGVFLAHLIFSLDYYSEPQKTQFREAAAYIAANGMPGEAVVVGCAHRLEYFNYYFERGGSPLRVRLWGCREEQLRGLFRTLEEREPRQIWYIRADRLPEEGVVRALRRELEPAGHREFEGAEVWLFKEGG